MGKEIDYNRNAVTSYAHRWATERNPKFYDYESIGGDCTNFASQCIYAGSGVMNYEKTFGWYYISPNDKAPAWTGVEYLYNFLTRRSNSTGPFAISTSMEEIQAGDIIQLAFSQGHFAHTLVVVHADNPSQTGSILVVAHTINADYRPLSTYNYDDIRYLHINGVYA